MDDVHIIMLTKMFFFQMLVLIFASTSRYKNFLGLPRTCTFPIIRFQIWPMSLVEVNLCVHTIKYEMSVCVYVCMCILIYGFWLPDAGGYTLADTLPLFNWIPDSSIPHSLAQTLEVRTKTAR